METSEIIRASGFIILLGISLFFTIQALLHLYKLLKKGKPNPERVGNYPERIKLFLVNVMGQKKLLRHPAGYGHLFIFYGFIFVTIIAQEAFIRAFFPSFSLSFLGPIYIAMIFVEDILSILVSGAIIVGVVRRYIIKPIRFKDDLVHSGGLNRDATIILIVVALHMIFGVLLESIEIAAGVHHAPDAAIVSKFFSTMWPANLAVAENIVWWLHAFSVWLFMIYIFATNIRVPRYYPSKHFHILAAAINIFFGNLKPMGRLQKLDFEDEDLEIYGVNKIEDLPWNQMLDLYSCTGCGRCQEVCPAYLTGQPLSPKALILNMREQLLEFATEWDPKEGEEVILKKELIGDVVPHETLWACVTCHACTTACPVFIEHIDKIVDQRRYLSMMESEFPPQLQVVYENLEKNSNPWGIGKSDRDKWAEELNLKRMKDDPDTPVLFWVGCAGSFDEHAQRVATDLIKILRAADIDFAILGKEEGCTGDIARRTGNEYLAQELMVQNVEILNSYNFKEVITICPHCYNNLANELPDFDGHYRVFHAVEFVSKLIMENKIQLDKSEPLNVTYHDSCYLGRYNKIYDPPRTILGQFEGVNFIEMEMTKDMALCCGGGGGRAFYETEGGTDINKMRVNMAVDTGADTVAVSCPYCTIMLEDGIKNMNAEIKVEDLIEIVAKRLK